MTLSLADGPFDSLQLAQTPGGELSGGFGRFTRKLAGIASTFAPPGVSGVLNKYSTMPEFKPKGGSAPSPVLSPIGPGYQSTPEPTPSPFTPAPYGSFLPAVQTKGFLTPKNLMIGGGVVLALVIGYAVMHKK